MYNDITIVSIELGSMHVNNRESLSQGIARRAMWVVVQTSGTCMYCRAEPVGLGARVDCVGGGLQAACGVGDCCNAEAGGRRRCSRRRPHD